MGIKSAVLTGILLASSALVACGGGYRSGYVAYSVPPPPAPYAVGAVGYAPGPGYVWVDGFWNLNGGRWAWVNGRWAVPPRGHCGLGSRPLGTPWQRLALPSRPLALAVTRLQ